TKYIVNQEKVLLGDEMGLGKTMQAIATMCHLKAQGKNRFLVVAPLSVLINWTREVSNNSNLKVIKCYGDDYETNFNEWKENGGVLVTTYETVKKLDDLELPVINFMAVDEAHYVKNPNSQRTQALVTVKQKAERILFMTGTPIENNVDEMCFLVRCLQTDVAKELEKYKSIAQAEEFKRKLAPVYLRRVREDVLTELPELTEKEEWVTLNNEEIKVYKQALKDKSFMAMRHVSWNVDVENSSKAQRLLEICDEAKLNGRKVLVFTYFKEVINKVQQILGDRCLTPITGAVKASDRQAIVDELSNAPDGTVLICQVLAGGVGLNIQAASTVVFCEPQLKPSMETQAIARSYRMGQARSVMVHRLLCDDTVDERIMEILAEKANIFENFADESIIAEEDKKLSEVDDLIAKERERWQVEE
ncbi:MAG: DEAD/DEAH box helicase, partial [Clostridia bacterium]|nr:DEAD/DEAH box helicase [Clostridia bacterium]